jgi:septal ring factor EnvC (AmiA/AmiB activator)
MKHQLALFLALLFFSVSALGQSAPLPKSKQESIGAYERKLEEEKARQQAIKKEMQTLSDMLETTKDKLMEIARSIRDNEGNLQTIEARIAEMEIQEKALKEKLEKDQIAISRLVLALERITRVPPQALILRPGAPLQTAQSAMLLADIIPVINKKTRELRDNLKELEAVTISLAADRADILQRKETLESEQKKLAVLIDDRESLFIKTQKDYKKHQSEIKKISAQAENLRDLVKKLDENNRRLAEENRKKLNAAKQTILSDELPQLGSAGAILPVSGIIRTAYNQKDKFGAPIKGIKIEGRSKGLVIAPMPGKVRYTGDFKNYGNMIIIEHKGGYHSLIAGLEKIDTLVGQTVKTGEPIGYLKNSSGGQNPSLYYELRLNGQPINPAKKLAGVG